MGWSDIAPGASYEEPALRAGWSGSSRNSTSPSSRVTGANRGIGHALVDEAFS
jgi:hypothetical protein